MADSREVVINKALEMGMDSQQLKNFLNAEYIPQPVQIEFHIHARECDKFRGPDRVGQGGTRGGSKTHAAFAQVALDDCQRYPGLKALYLRMIQKAAGEQVDDLIYKVLHNTEFEYVRTSGVINFPNGSRIIIGGFKNESDIGKYVGVEYDLVVIEEATQLSKAKMDLIGGSLRSTMPGYQERMYLCTNPGGIGHQWFKEEFVIPFREKRATDTRYVHSTYHDNAFISPRYKKYLESLSGSLKLMWADGDWDTFAGMALPSFNYDIHTVVDHVLPDYFYRWRGVDYGLHSPSGCLWAARDPDMQRIFIYRELYEREKTDRQVARMVKERSIADPRIELSYADPSMWSRKPYKDMVFSSADEWAAEGVPLIRADNDRDDGLTRVARVLGLLPDGKPQLIIFRSCENLIRELSNLPIDPDRPTRAETKNVDDHLYDCLRYLLSRYKVEKYDDASWDNELVFTQPWLNSLI